MFTKNQNKEVGRQTDNKFRAILSIAILLLFGVQAVFAQNQQWLDIGGDHANPILDPFLLQHSMYADNNFGTNSGSTSPRDGIVGGRNFVGGMFTLNTNGRFDNAAISQWGGAGVAPNDNQLLRGADAYPANASTNREVMINGVRTTINGRPRLPRITGQANSGNDVAFTGPITNTHGNLSAGQHGALNANVNQNRPASLGAGVYFFRSIFLESGTIVNVNPGAGTTIVYVQGNMSLQSNAGFVIPANAQGSVLFIVMGDVSMVSPAYFHGTLIAPNGTITTGDQSNIVGQIAANNLNLTGYRGGEHFTFNPWNPANITVTVQNTTFTKNWVCYSDENP